MINFVIVHSTFESIDSISLRLAKFLEKFSKSENISAPEFISSVLPDDKVKILNSAPLIIMATTGGVEQIAAKLIKDSLLPILLIAPNQKNAVAASLEIYSCYKHKNNFILKYINNVEQLSKQLNNFTVVADTIIKINKVIFGSIGSPSDWLLTSQNVTKFGSFYTKIVNISTNELIEEVSGIPDNDVQLTEFNNHLSVCKNEHVSNSSITNSGKVYVALNKIIDKYKLNALSIRCFDLLDHNYTSCMALSYLNDNGIVAGCEGDLHATFSMMIAAYLTARPSWMANPSSINFEDNSITFAHCSTPLKVLMPDSIELNTHMESGLSVAVEGELPAGEVSIFRTGGNFDKMLLITGRLIQSNMGDPNLCRTQAIITLDGNLNKWLENSLGNHQVIVFSDISSKLKTFCRLTNIELIEVE
ncbi:MAG: hypothetical protein V1773_12475 [bacterium]